MAISVQTLVPTPNGWYKAGELQKGSLVFDRYGLASTVTSTQLYTPTKMFRLWYTDGTYVECDGNQKIEVIQEAMRYNHSKIEANRQRAPRSDQKLRFKTVQELFDGPLKDKRGRLDLSTKTTNPVHFYTEDHPVPPFIAGWWYSRRSSKQTNILIRPKIRQYFKAEFEKLRWRVIQKKNGKLDVPQSIGTTMLTRYGTIPNLMPVHYQFGSPQQRIDLLRGIMVNYIESYKPDKDTFSIETKRHSFARLIQGVLESLGVRVMSSKRNKDIVLVFRTTLPLLPWQKQNGPQTSYKYRLIAEVHEIETRPCIHIETDKPMLVTASYISTWH